MHHTFNVKENINYQILINSFESTFLLLSIKEDFDFNKIILSGKNEYIFNYYSIFNGIITIIIESDSKYTMEFKEQTIRIDQIYVSSVLQQAFLYDLKCTLDLTNYYDDYRPAIFYGIMDDTDFKKLNNNKSLKIIIWVGGDINRNNRMNLERINQIRNMKRVIHIAISSFICNDMIELKLPYKNLPIMGVNFDLYKPIIKGPAIYLYTDLRSENTYGKNIYVKLMEKYKNTKFIVTCCKVTYDRCILNKTPLKYGISCHDKQELISKIYPQCFIGLRLTTHDGLAGTVQELGLLGIKCIHNGSSPSSLNYKNFDDICNHIDNEMKTINTKDEKMAEHVRQYLTIDQSFMYI